jgi:dienelactone hydrolase
MSFPNQNPLYPPGYTPPQQQVPQPRPVGGSKAWLILVAIGGGSLVLLLVCCGMIGSFFSAPRASAAARQPFVTSDVPLPAFGERAAAELVDEGVERQAISVGSDRDGFYSPPGHGGEMLLHLPPGDHAPRSLPCILITGAGTDLLSGVLLEGEGNPDEYISYVQAGLAVLVYELDGPSGEEGDVAAMQEALAAYRGSRAGLVNARNALEYALTKVPEVNPAKIYAAGHSSAGTHALLFAAHEPRLAGVIAYAPACDVPKWFGPRLWMMSKLLPGSTDFITQCSPSTHQARIKCPTFLFHAEDDSICEPAETQAFAEQLKQQGTDVTMVTVPTGDHYESMIQQGIPAAIDWLQKRR